MLTSRQVLRVVLLVGAVLLVAVVAFVASGSRDEIAPPPPSPPRVWTPIVVTPEGNEMVQPNTLRLEFWTPSARTKEFLARQDGTIADRDKWEAIPSEDPVIEFGKKLRADTSVLGYRRVEVWGHGRTVLKPGWWWTMAVTTNYSVEKLNRAYRDFWRSSNAVFVEVTDNRGHQVP